MKRLREIKNGELYYNGYNLTSLAKKYGTPLKITFLDVIKEHVLSLKEAFDKSIKKNNYNAKFIYLNANKANYGKEEIETSFLYSDGLETSSYYDLLLTHKFFVNYPEFKNKYIVSNGYKQQDYMDEIIKIHELGYNIIDIIDSKEEYEYLKESKARLNVGLRIHISSLYEPEVLDDRFGLNKEELEYILSDLKNTNLNLTTIHYHQRGFDFEKDKFNLNLTKTFNYYLMAKKDYPSLQYFDIGGGCPLPLEEGFDYDSWCDNVILTLKEECKKNNVEVPNIIGENGKFSQKDSTVNIYKVVAHKNTGEYPWAVVNGSLLIALPEMYALGEPIIVMPINGLDKEKEKVRLGGITCDCDDVFFDKEKGYFELPKIDEQYIGLIGTGSYQNSMNGKGGVHHCLLPEEKDVVIYTKDNKEFEYVRNDLQSIEKICEIIKF